MHIIENFSTCKRSALIEELGEKNFDILIFGGGITGAGIALDASSRGLKVALIEQNDFASGTSSRSTKLIHGGLRYLKQLQFRFVSQLGNERRTIRSIAQNNVIPIPVLLPIYKKGGLKKGLSAIGLFIYERIAKVNNSYKSKWIKRDELIKRYNFIQDKGLKGAFLYYEFKTNDGRLVIEALKKSVEHGAICLNYANPIKIKQNEDKVSGAVVQDLISGTEFTINAHMIINATGVWCQKFMQQFNFELPKNLFPTKGVHLALAKEKLPVSEAFYIDTLDDRMIFVIPRENHVYIGTTDTTYTSDYRNPVVTVDDANYLLDSVNRKFPKLNLQLSDVESCWAGIRPLIKDAGKSPGEVSRRDELFLADNGLLTITGGKLTGYRLMAEKVVDNILIYLNKDEVKCCTQNLNLSGSEWDTELDTQKLVEQADYAFDEAKQTGINPISFKPLYYRYGKNIAQITEKAYEYLNIEKEPEKLWLMAELWYGVNFEMVSSLSDFFIRRTEMVLFDLNKVEELKLFAAEHLGKLLNWSDQQISETLKNFETDWKNYKLAQV